MGSVSQSEWAQSCTQKGCHQADIIGVLLNGILKLFVPHPDYHQICILLFVSFLLPLFLYLFSLYFSQWILFLSMHFFSLAFLLISFHIFMPPSQKYKIDKNRFKNSKWMLIGLSDYPIQKSFFLFPSFFPWINFLSCIFFSSLYPCA